jgi:hypothetical protein
MKKIRIIRDGKKSDLGPGINIPDPQHYSIHIWTATSLWQSFASGLDQDFSIGYVDPNPDSAKQNKSQKEEKITTFFFFKALNAFFGGLEASPVALKIIHGSLGINI